MDIEDEGVYFFVHVLCWSFITWFVWERLNAAP